MANEHQLGEPKPEQTVILWGRGRIIGAIIVLLIYIVSLSLLLYFNVLKALDLNILLLSILISSIFVGFIALLIIFIGYKNRNTRFFIYEYGCVIVRCSHQQIVSYEAINWQEVETTWERSETISDGENTSVYYIARIQCRDGRFFGDQTGFFQDKRGQRPEANFVVNEIVNYQWPQTIAQHQQGRPIAFGSVVIQQDGIECRGAMLSWQEYGSIKRNDNTVIIKQRGQRAPWITLPYQQVPNFTLLQKLLNYIMKTPRL